ncbi:MAG: carbon storage regulator [Planctomycetaceae bacterium]|nr:carbon storage regulator [Planctomycetales bacterium]MCB9924189.1 carbon storage regulator [Planctomycetaceae bacterium]
MLVLNRKVLEQIVIGKHVVLTVSQIRGNRVRLTISTPKAVRIVRRKLTRVDDLLQSHTKPLLLTPIVGER